MSRLYNKFWINVTIVLSLIFIILGFPAFRRSHGLAISILITFLGVGFIWITYVIRVYCWSDSNEKKQEEK